MQPGDAIRLQHMLEAAREAIELSRGRTRRDFHGDRQLALALTRLVEILGEAASRVSPQGQQRWPEIPWRVAIAMRNRLIHAYFDIDFDLVWDTVNEDLPPLVEQLTAILDDDNG
jgi:uncharacterized protein with HEPN domain